MFSKLAILCVAALAVVAQAGHHKRHTHSHQNGTLTQNPFLAQAGLSSGVAPYPTGTGASSPLGTGASLPLPTTGQSGDTTLTYVVGTGSAKSTVVTTIRHTSYKTDYNVSIFV